METLPLRVQKHVDNTRKLEKVIPNVRCEVLADCGHMLMAEKPNQVLDRLIEFLA
jgi:pimeloyl-ACP methyl ester carboxylesterase